MKYITHRRYQGLALCGERLNLPYGTTLQSEGEILTTMDGKAVCCRASENAKMHFARDDDGQGLERGALSWAIAYSQRQRKSKNGALYRFSDKERAMLSRDWRKFLRTDLEMILFNDNFFAAELSELQKLAAALQIKIKRR